MQTVAEKALGTALQRSIDRKLLAYAVERQITCPVSGVVLDVRRAVLVRPQEGEPLVMSADAWDRVRGGVFADMPGVEVYDGRELFGRRKSEAKHTKSRAIIGRMGATSSGRTWRP